MNGLAEQGTSSSSSNGRASVDPETVLTHRQAGKRPATETPDIDPFTTPSNVLSTTHEAVTGPAMTKPDAISRPIKSSGTGTRSPLSLSNISLPTLDFPKMDLSKLPKLPNGPNIEVNFAPLTIPRHRRLQTALVALWSLALPICLITFLVICSIPILWPFVGPYLIWMLYVDTAPRRGGRPSLRFRRWVGWRYFAAYYPVSIIKEADLPADRPYVFGYHPHGIIGTGAFTNFATDATGFSTLFPGIKPHLLTLSLNFHTPIYRDILLFLGVCSVSKRSCVNTLRQGPGSAITIVVGGAAESLAAHPGTNDLTLRKRLGFIKIAVREGADLVPVFSFGENDIYEQLSNQKGTTVYTIQKRFQKLFGFTLPLFHGRGIFNYNLGLMPFRHPVVSVVGKPIHVVQDDNPSTATLEAYQKEYIAELMRVWEAYKDVHARNRTRELRVVE